MIIAGNYSLPNEISKEARNLLAHIMSLDPNARPSIDEILADPWMKDVNENSNNYYLHLNYLLVILFTNEEIAAIRKEYDFRERVQDKSFIEDAKL